MARFASNSFTRSQKLPLVWVETIFGLRHLWFKTSLPQQPQKQQTMATETGLFPLNPGMAKSVIRSCDF
jgi:hypothetical protein